MEGAEEGQTAHPPPPVATATPSKVKPTEDLNKKPVNNQFQFEAETEIQWRSLLRREGLIVVDVYPGWTGPCTSMVAILKRIKAEVNDDRLWYAVACSDDIDDLLMFKDQSEPTWLFMGGGKPVGVIRGSNVPVFVTAVKAAFQHELECIEGKSRRNLISIDDEESKRKKAEAEAGRLATFVVEEENEAAEHLNVIRRESSVSLMGALEPYTVVIIQAYLVASGDGHEIKDFLSSDFEIIEEIELDMTEDSVRQLYKIPYEIPDPTAINLVETEEPTNDDAGADDDDEDIPTKTISKPSKAKKKMLAVPLPNGLVGPTYVLLVESLDLKKLKADGKSPSTHLKTVDDYIRTKVGPVKFKDAQTHAPHSLHASYGKADVPGVWCPRKYDDKRYVILNMFPNFVQEMLKVLPQEPKKYLLAVFPVNNMNSVKENPDIADNVLDIVGEGRMRIPKAVVDAMLESAHIQGGDMMMKTAALTADDLYVISVNRKNQAMNLALKSLKPIHLSVDEENGRIETSKLFPKLKIPLTEEQTPEEIFQKFMARTTPRFPQEESVMDMETLDEMLLEMDEEFDEEGDEEDTEVPPGDGEGEEEDTEEEPDKDKDKEENKD